MFYAVCSPRVSPKIEESGSTRGCVTLSTCLCASLREPREDPCQHVFQTNELVCFGQPFCDCGGGESPVRCAVGSGCCCNGRDSLGQGCCLQVEDHRCPQIHCSIARSGTSRSSGYRRACSSTLLETRQTLPECCRG